MDDPADQRARPQVRQTGMKFRRKSDPNPIFRPCPNAKRPIPLLPMDKPLPILDTDGPARRNVMVLVAAQAILGAQMPMIFVVAGLAGKQLAPNACFATLSISVMVIGSMLSANPLSALMARFGRRAGFVVGALGGALGGGVAAYGLSIASFPLFLVGAFLSGIYQSSQGFFRFAAADSASDAFRPKAISWVMAGGLLSAVVGPELVKLTSQSMAVPFMGTYLAVIGLNLVGMFLFAGLNIPKLPARSGAVGGRTRMEMLRTPRILVAVIVGTVSYAPMKPKFQPIPSKVRAM